MVSPSKNQHNSLQTLQLYFLTMWKSKQPRIAKIFWDNREILEESPCLTSEQVLFQQLIQVWENSTELNEYESDTCYIFPHGKIIC